MGPPKTCSIKNRSKRSLRDHLSTLTCWSKKSIAQVRPRMVCNTATFSSTSSIRRLDTRGLCGHPSTRKQWKCMSPQQGRSHVKQHVGTTTTMIPIIPMIPCLQESVVKKRTLMPILWDGTTVASSGQRSTQMNEVPYNGSNGITCTPFLQN